MGKKGPQVHYQKKNLTDREKEVLRAIYRGMTRRQIAKDLVISYKTVENCVNRLYDKMQAGSDVLYEELGKYAVEHGYIEGEHT